MHDNLVFNENNAEEFVNDLRKKAILLNHGRLLQILINIFAEKKYLEKLSKREGQEVQIDFPGYGLEMHSLTFVLSKSPIDPYFRRSENPKVTIIFNVSEEKVIPLLVNIVSSKYNVFGVLKLVFKYLLTGKVKYKPKTAIFTLLAFLRCFLIGRDEMVKKNPLKTGGKK